MSAQLVHSNVTTTANIHGHVSEAAEREVAEKIGAILDAHGS